MVQMSVCLSGSMSLLELEGNGLVEISGRMETFGHLPLPFAVVKVMLVFDTSGTEPTWCSAFR